MGKPAGKVANHPHQLPCICTMPLLPHLRHPPLLHQPLHISCCIHVVLPSPLEYPHTSSLTQEQPPETMLSAPSLVPFTYSLPPSSCYPSSTVLTAHYPVTHSPSDILPNPCCTCAVPPLPFSQLHTVSSTQQRLPNSCHTHDMPPLRPPLPSSSSY